MPSACTPRVQQHRQQGFNRPRLGVGVCGACEVEDTDVCLVVPFIPPSAVREEVVVQNHDRHTNNEPHEKHVFCGGWLKKVWHFVNLMFFTFL